MIPLVWSLLWASGNISFPGDCHAWCLVCALRTDLQGALLGGHQPPSPCPPQACLALLAEDSPYNIKSSWTILVLLPYGADCLSLGGRQGPVCPFQAAAWGSTPTLFFLSHASSSPGKDSTIAGLQDVVPSLGCPRLSRSASQPVAPRGWLPPSKLLKPQ